LPGKGQIELSQSRTKQCCPLKYGIVSVYYFLALAYSEIIIHFII
jgi:hypothetical protein